ncbi:unnamed protein product [Linum tenue]|uniref:Seed maturation protein n=2 Tax=Linum tenue TaxID=586396 RepID=A0AAV0RGQ7_9ROSI|nr:unnamed protein product [Linum tenue]
MAKSKDDIKYGTAQAKLSEDEAMRIRYEHGTPLEGGKIADSQPVELFSGAHRVADANADERDSSGGGQSQPDRPGRKLPIFPPEPADGESG